jgi:hypothetical protein
MKSEHELLCELFLLICVMLCELYLLSGDDSGSDDRSGTDDASASDDESGPDDEEWTRNVCSEKYIVHNSCSWKILFHLY